jgi:hypothetical protein
MWKLGTIATKRAILEGMHVPSFQKTHLIKEKIYHDALGPVEQDPAAAMVSPSLMGSCGVVPLTIISVYVTIQIP